MKSPPMKSPPVKNLRMRNLRAPAILPIMAAACLAAAGCMPQPPRPAPPPPMSQPAAVAMPAPAPAPAVAAAPLNWLDAEQTPGDWKYRTAPGGSQALFGQPGAGAQLTLECSRSAGQVLLVRAGDAGGPVPMRILTETQARVVTSSPDRSAMPVMVAALPAGDPLLDAMAISKGRFAVETTGMATIYAPSWPEVSRVIEDCR